MLFNGNGINQEATPSPTSAVIIPSTAAQVDVLPATNAETA
jgi:hypothetical protein